VRSLFLFIGAFVFLPGFGQDFKLNPSKKVALTGHEGGVRTIWFANDNNSLCGDDNFLMRWDIQSGKLIQKTEIPGYTTQQSCISNNQALWVQSNSNYSDSNKKDITNMHSNLNVFSYPYDKMTSTKIPDFYIKDQAFLPNRDIQLLVIASEPETYYYSLKVFSLNQMKSVTNIVTTKSSSDLMITLAVSEDGKIAAVGYAGKNSRIEIYDLINLKLLKSFKTEGEVHKVRIANGIAVGAGANTLTVIDLNAITKTKSIKTTAGCFALAISPNGKTVAIGDRSGAELVDLESEKTTPLYSGQCQSLCFDSKGSMVAVGVFKSMHIADIPSAFIFFNENESTNPSNLDNSGSETKPIIEENTWFHYSQLDPTFEIDLPAEPENKNFTSSSGVKQIQLKSLGKQNGVMINIAEAKKVKSKNYYSKSRELGEKFIENMGDGIKIESSGDCTFKESKGTSYVFTKGRFKYFYRCVIVKGYLYQMTFFTSDDSSNDYERFFNSFKY
jgi:hypothetical protein